MLCARRARPHVSVCLCQVQDLVPTSPTKYIWDQHPGVDVPVAEDQHVGMYIFLLNMLLQANNSGLLKHHEQT
jgi:hypothetical protein